MQIYCFSQQCVEAGRVCNCPNRLEHYRAGADDQSADIFLWGEGEEDELIAQAREDLAKRYDNRFGGAGNGFRWKCARNVLDYFGASAEEVED